MKEKNLLKRFKILMAHILAHKMAPNEIVVKNKYNLKKVYLSKKILKKKTKTALN